MASQSSSSATGASTKRMGLIANAMKRKDSFVQFFIMTGILMISLRSLGQKYRIHDLATDNSELREENKSLSLRMESIRGSLLREAAALDPSGALKSRLDRLFLGSSSNNNNN
ncbi:uncharacterized protein M6B38_129165 [Iris pallida]|uniref:Uncharacterized protein n=1 Tax=Iris pallida TaxID=29817 RepID=A0AAX6G666_IRIPA|nr:uncharacterized protein M6B38_129165 [Iris pallida]